MILKDNMSSVLLKSNIGLEIEFYSKHEVDKTSTLLSRLLTKKISVEDKAHSDFQPTQHHFKIEPDMSGGQGLLELVTGSMPYDEARLTIIRVLKWVQENGSTGDRTGLHINVSFDDGEFGQTFLSHMNILKFILEFDEDYVYKSFPSREGLVYSKSIKTIIPNDKYHFDNLDNINPHHFIVPSEKYYGINFEKLQKNYLEFRYLGGNKYEHKISDILNMVDHFVSQLYTSAKDREFTDENKNDLVLILRRHKRVTDAYRNFDDFHKLFPDIGILIDMDSDDRRIDSYWGTLQDRIYEIMVNTKVKEGFINYDSDTGRIQLKQMDLTESFKIEGLDLIECKVSGVVTKCDIYECELINAECTEINLFKASTGLKCKIHNSYVNQTVKLKDCYVYGKNGLMNGEMTGGIFREGRMTPLSKFIDVEIVEFEKISTKYNVSY